MFFCAACRLNPAETPFPANDNGFSVPVTQGLHFDKPKPFVFTAISPDSVVASGPQSFNLDKLPATPFSLNDFKTMPAPIREVKLDWNNLPDSAVNMGVLPERLLRMQQSVLPKPVIVKAGMPKLMPNTSSGVLQFSVEEGLPGMAVSACLTDSFGTTWLATEKGLCRYTGDHLNIYSFARKTAVGSDYAIAQMALDRKGNIWIATEGDGIYMIDVRNGILLHDRSQLFCLRIMCDHDGLLWVTSAQEGIFIINTDKWSIKNFKNPNAGSFGNQVTAIKEDRSHNIWLGYADHIAVLNANRDKVRKITHAQSLPADLALSFCEDWQGDMWIGLYGEGIEVVSLKNNTLGFLEKKNGFEGIGVELVEDQQQRLWILRKDTSYVLAKDRHALKKVLAPSIMIDPRVRGSAMADSYGNIWMGTVNRGVVLIDTKGPLIENIDDKSGLADNNVWGTAEDKQGLIWLGTRLGLNIYDPEKQQLKLFGSTQGLGGRSAGRIDKDTSGNIIVSTSQGFDIINAQAGTFENYRIKQNTRNFFVSKCTTDGNGRLWVNSLAGIYVYDFTNKELKQLSRQTGLLSNLTWDMYADRHGNMWAASDSGVTIINTRNNTLTYLREKDGLCNNTVYKIMEGPGGKIWIATIKGISVVDMEKQTISNLNRQQGLQPEDVYDLVLLNGTMYAGTSNGMIAISQPGSPEGSTAWHFANYGKRQGFMYNDFNQNTAMATRKGQIWWGVVPVLAVVTQEPLKDGVPPGINITAINIMDQPVSFAGYNSISNHMMPGDTLWNEAKTNYYTKNHLPKDSGYLQNNGIRWDSITGSFAIPAGLQLPYHQNSVNFSFSNNNIYGRERVSYRYILEGADTAWSAISDKSNTKNYFNLGAGDYTFRVRTKGINGYWSQEATCHFRISPPWWKTWWAYFLYVLLAAALGTVYANYRSNQLRRENAELENKVNLRTGELSKSLEELKAAQAQLVQAEKMASLGELTAGIAHEIQNPLNFVNNFSEVSRELMEELKSQKSQLTVEEQEDLLNDIDANLEKINHHGKRADAIVKGMLQHSRNSSGQKEPTDVNALCDEYLRLSYHGLRARDKSFNATLKTDFDPAIGIVNIAPQEMGRVLMNLITNAFYAVNEKRKSSAAGYEPMLKVSTRKTAGKIEIRVEDNGNGIPQNIIDKIFQPFFTTKPTGQGTGLGLSLAYDIVTKGHAGELKVETKENEGTLFIIRIPVNQ